MNFSLMVYWFITAQMSLIISSVHSFLRAGSNTSEEDKPEPY